MHNVKKILTPLLPAIIFSAALMGTAQAHEQPRAYQLVRNERDFCTKIRIRYARCLAHMADSGMDRGGARDACWYAEPSQFGCR